MRDSRLKSTEYYEYTNLNPKNRISEDCVIRGVALVTGKSWEETIKNLTELGLKEARVCNDSKLFPLYLKQNGFVEMNEPRDVNNRKMSIKEFLIEHPEITSFLCIAGSHHVTAVKDRKVRDIWNSSTQTMHRWWVKR